MQRILTKSLEEIVKNSYVALFFGKKAYFIHAFPIIQISYPAVVARFCLESTKELVKKIRKSIKIMQKKTHQAGEA